MPPLWAKVQPAGCRTTHPSLRKYCQQLVFLILPRSSLSRFLIRPVLFCLLLPEPKPPPTHNRYGALFSCLLFCLIFINACNYCSKWRRKGGWCRHEAHANGWRCEEENANTQGTGRQMIAKVTSSLCALMVSFVLAGAWSRAWGSQPWSLWIRRQIQRTAIPKEIAPRPRA